MYAPQAVLVLSGAEAVESKMPSKGNNCLLRSLTYNGAPRGSDQSAASMHALREAIAAAVIALVDVRGRGSFCCSAARCGRCCTHCGRVVGIVMGAKGAI